MRYLLAVILLLITLPSYAADRLVPSQYATIQAAHNAASPGDTILISDGYYPGTITITKSNLTFKSVNYLGARIAGEYRFANGFISQGNNISNITIDGVDIFGFTSRGIAIPANYTGLSSWTIRRTKIHHCWQFGIYMRGNDHLVENNWIYFIGNTAEAYAIYSFSDGTIIRNNTIHTASKNAVRMRNGTLLDSNIIYHSDTCLAVNGGPGGNSAYNNYIYDCLSAMKPKHNECTNTRNNGRERFWHNTVTDFGNVGLDIAENEPRTKCIDGRNNVFHRSGVRGDSAVMERRGNVDIPSVINGNFYDMNGLPLYTDVTANLESMTLAEMRTRYGYETNGVVGNSGLINRKQGVFYTPGSPVFNPGPNTGSPYTTQVGARNLVQTTPMVEYVETLRAINSSTQSNIVSRLTDGQKLPQWNSGARSGWIILQTNNGNPATFGVFSFLAFSPDTGGKIRNFTLQSGPTANGPWTQILEDGGLTGLSGSYSFFELPAPVSTAYLRFNFLDVYNNQDVILSELDIFNFVPQSGPPPPPPPDDDEEPPPQVDHAQPPLYAGGEGTGTQRYISPGGAGTTCSSGTPCSWTTAINASQPNDAIIFKNGLGDYNITMRTVRSGQAGRHIVIKADAGGTPLINGSGADLVHIEHSYITIRGLHFFDTKTGFPNATNSGGSLVLMRVNNTSGANHIIIEDNTFENCANACINAFGITNKNSHIIIRNNFFDGAGYKNDTAGRPIRISTPLVGNPGVEDTMIYGNIIQDFTGPAIEISDTGNRTWIWDNDIRGAATAASHGVSPEPPRDGLILNRGSETYFYRNVVRDSAFGAKILTTRVSGTGAKSQFYNNVFDSITGNDDAVYCETGNIGPASDVYNNTFRGLTDHTVGTTNCAITVVNNIGINGVSNNLATANFADNYFNDADAGDFSLTVNAVNAIDAVTTEPYSRTDKTSKGIFGTARDYGAFEFGGFGPPPPPPGTGFPTTAVLDDFNRTNADPIAGATLGGVSTGQTWVNGVSGTGACKVDTNTLRRSSGTFDCYLNTQYGASQELYVTLPNQTNPGDLTTARIRGCVHGGIGAAGTYNAYSLQWQKRADTDRMFIFKVTAGAGVQIGDYFEQELVNGNKVGLEILEDGTLNAYADTGSGFELKFTRVDSSPFDCTNSYISANPQGNLNHWFDDFGGGTSVATVPGNLLVPKMIFFDAD